MRLTNEQLEGMDMWDSDVMLAPEHRAVGSMLVSIAIAEVRRSREIIAAVKALACQLDQVGGPEDGGSYAMLAIGRRLLLLLKEKDNEA